MRRGWLIYDATGKLDGLLRSKAVSRSAFSDLSGVNEVTLRKMLEGETPLDLRVVLAAQVVLGYPLQNFMGEARFYAMQTAKGKRGCPSEVAP